MRQGDLIRSARFRQEREADWRKLEHLVTQAETKGLRNVTFADARDLSAL